MRKVFFFFNIQILKLYIPKPSPIHGPKPGTRLKPRSLNLGHNTFPIKKKTQHIYGLACLHIRIQEAYLGLKSGP